MKACRVCTEHSIRGDVYNPAQCAHCMGFGWEPEPHPILVGIIPLAIPYARRLPHTPGQPAIDEKISSIGFDTTGQAWGLVVRITEVLFDPAKYGRTLSGAPYTLSRLSYSSWVKFPSIPFNPREYTAEEWTKEFVEKPAEKAETK